VISRHRVKEYRRRNCDPNEISFVKNLDTELRLHGKGLIDYTS